MATLNSQMDAHVYCTTSWGEEMATNWTCTKQFTIKWSQNYCICFINGNTKRRESAYQSPEETTLESDKINFPPGNKTCKQQADTTTERHLITNKQFFSGIFQSKLQYGGKRKFHRFYKTAMVKMVTTEVYKQLHHMNTTD